MLQIFFSNSRQAKHHNRATMLQSLSHLSHVSVWCSRSKFRCHFSNVETETWRFAFFEHASPVSLLLALLLSYGRPTTHFYRPFCQTANMHGRSRDLSVRILSVDRPLYLFLFMGTGDRPSLTYIPSLLVPAVVADNGSRFANVAAVEMDDVATSVWPGWVCSPIGLLDSPVSRWDYEMGCWIS